MSKDKMPDKQKNPDSLGRRMLILSDQLHQNGAEVKLSDNHLKAMMAAKDRISYKALLYADKVCDELQQLCDAYFDNKGLLQYFQEDEPIALLEPNEVVDRLKTLLSNICFDLKQSKPEEIYPELYHDDPEKSSEVWMQIFTNSVETMLTPDPEKQAATVFWDNDIVEYRGDYYRVADFRMEDGYVVLSDLNCSYHFNVKESELRNHNLAFTSKRIPYNESLTAFKNSAEKLKV